MRFIRTRKKGVLISLITISSAGLSLILYKLNSIEIFLSGGSILAFIGILSFFYHYQEFHVYIQRYIVDTRQEIDKYNNKNKLFKQQKKEYTKVNEKIHRLLKKGAIEKALEYSIEYCKEKDLTILHDKFISISFQFHTKKKDYHIEIIPQKEFDHYKRIICDLIIEYIEEGSNKSF